MLAGRFLSRVPESDSFPVWDEWLEVGVVRGTNASDTLNSTSARRERDVWLRDRDQRSRAGKQPLGQALWLFPEAKAPDTSTCLSTVDVRRGRKDRRTRGDVGTIQNISHTSPLVSFLLKNKDKNMEYEKGQGARITYLSHKVRCIYFDIKQK